MNIWFAAASALSVLWLGVHLFIGGREVAAPLRNSDLPPLVRDTQWLCWHYTTMAIGVMAAIFGLAAWSGETAYALSGLMLAVGFAVFGIVLAPLVGAPYRRVPQGWLFVPVVALGVLGLLS
ncbi:hypothetical protein KUH32_01880 [Thalassococcus sp. CAU 1522]|uniref:DUF1304 domain-containing protein n=1 Tax=Thalassococcus arenae TaxID=2851652 RepID=A0ABS6N3B0_9RHOB|nr:hypothetical protein [Thalassococcus arenae]MBV2358512.1 hypothetical protein [Thalassococcus arenae]